MREIKFRGWYPSVKKMRNFSDGIIIADDQDRYGMFFKCTEGNVFLSKCEVMQFTGLKDKNGKEIYEGDIVKFGQYEYQIIYEIGGFGLLDAAGLMIGKIGGINDHVYSLQVLYLECCWEESSAFDLEVIGNIHEA